MVAAFAAAVAVILVVALITTRVPHGGRTPAGGGVSAGGQISASGQISVSAGEPPTMDGPPQYTDPRVLPSGCNSAWALRFAGGQFFVTTRPDESCPPLSVRSFWLLDEASGNGNIGPGDATLWAVTPVATTAPMLTAPFAFRANPGWPGPTSGHTYTLAFVLPEELASVHSGDDAAPHLDRTHFLSLTVTSW